MSKTWRWALAVTGLLAVAALALGLRSGWGSAKPTAATAAEAASTAKPGRKAIELAPGDLARAERAELVQTLVISGSLKAFNSAFVKARVAAEVKQLTVREGDRVQTGQLIGQLDATEAGLRLRQSEDQVASAQAQLDIAQRALENNQALVGQGFISKNALDTSVSNAAAARASLQAARAAAELLQKTVRDSEIRAPIAGLVAQRLVQVGERVPIDTRLVEIVDLSRIELEAAVAAEDVLAVRVGQNAKVQIDGLAQPLTAKVVRINPSAQAGTRSVTTYLQLEANPALRQGLFARASIELQRRSALVVPASALRLDQSRPYVLAVEDGKAIEKPVITGGRGEVALKTGIEAAVEVTSGLSEGATVLRGGVGKLPAGTPLRMPGAALPSAVAVAAAVAVAVAVAVADAAAAAPALAASAPR